MPTYRTQGKRSLNFLSALPCLIALALVVPQTGNAASRNCKITAKGCLPTNRKAIDLVGDEYA